MNIQWNEDAKHFQNKKNYKYIHHFNKSPLMKQPTAFLPQLEALKKQHKHCFVIQERFRVHMSSRLLASVIGSKQSCNMTNRPAGYTEKFATLAQ